MKTIRLVVFNEDYWSKGLIYTQNIKPLIALSKEYDYNVEIVSFTPFLVYFKNIRKIAEFSNEIRNENVRIKNFLTCYYPTNLLITRWYLIPYLIFNTFIYVLYLRLSDRNRDIKYNLRSYESALIFYILYGKKGNLFFDTRTDWIEENINAGFFSKKGLSTKLWLHIEKKIVSTFCKTIFISKQFRDNVLSRHNLSHLKEKTVILYNPIDFKHFKREKVEHSEKVFLYTGSFGQWNRLDLYLDFFLGYYRYYTNTKFIICTNTSEKKVYRIIDDPKYSEIRTKIYVYFNVPLEKLPDYYCLCDYGLQLMSKKDSRISVKVVEYIAAGVVPIVNENVQGAADIINTYNLGIVLSEQDSMDIIAEKISKKTKIDTCSAGYKEFSNLVDLNSIASKLNSIYQ